MDVESGRRVGEGGWSEVRGVGGGGGRSVEFFVGGGGGGGGGGLRRVWFLVFLKNTTPAG